METEQRKEEERIRNRRTQDVKGKSTRDRKQVEVKERKGGEKVGLLFLSCSVPWVWQYQVNLGG